MKTPSLIVPVILLAWMLQSFAGDTSKEISTSVPQAPLPAFRAGAHEVELLGGAMFSLQKGNVNHRPELNYAIQELGYGWMLNDVHGPVIWHGNEELLLEAFGGEVFRGPHGGFGGGELILRHNFVPSPDSRFIPFIQFGGGGLGNDIYHNSYQSRIGEEFEFTLQTQAGIRWLINDRWGLTGMGGYRHISNAGLSSRNSGLDSFGGSLGINFLF